MIKIVFSLLAIGIIAFGFVYKSNYAKKQNNYATPHLSSKSLDVNLDYNGAPLKLNDYAGKVVVLYFGFTSCPDVCPMSLSYLNGVLKDIDPNLYQVIFVSVDYKRDTSESVNKYTNYFNKNYIGVTGSKEEIDKITNDFGVYYKFIDMPNSEMKYSVDHSSRFFIVNKKGKVVKSLRSDIEDKIFLKEFNDVLKEEE